MHYFSRKTPLPFLIFLFFQMPKSAIAQTQLGLRLENYAGINGIPLNPTAGINNPLGWDVNIAAAGSFFANNFAFIRNTNLISVLKKSRWLSASLPVSLLNYEQVRIGLAARLAFLTIGTDNLGSFLGQKRLTGSDFYVALKINALKIGQLKGGTGLFNGGSGKAAKCYRF